MNAGDTFFLANRDVEEHLWFVLSDPLRDSQRVVIASLTTWRADKDQACIIERGEHPFVTHKTCVSYGDAKIVADHFLDEQLAAGQLRAGQPLTPELLGRIREHAEYSRRMPTAAWQVLENQRNDAEF